MDIEPVTSKAERLSANSTKTLHMPTARAKSGVFCDTCKDAWGQIKDQNGKWTWHPKAMRQAMVTITSETHPVTPIIRSYCHSCIEQNSKWHDGSTWTIQQQIEYAKVNRPGQQLTIGGM
jgi:hypothetical protein